MEMVARRSGLGRRMKMLAMGMALAVHADCGVGQDDGVDARGDPAAAAPADSSGVSGEENPGVGEGDGTRAPPLLLGRGGLPVEILEPQTYALRLVNRTEQPAVVYADAGVGRVVLDTIEPADSARVNVEVRAREVRLRAMDLTGQPLITDTIALVADSLTRWEVWREGPDRL
jgi:hypothetical protein